MSDIPSSISELPDLAPGLRAAVADWSSINSGSNHVAGLCRMADALEIALRELTPHIERIPLDSAGRIALRATCRPTASRRVLCSGHYDTVFDPDHPFQTCRPGVIRNRLNGPGVADMKGGIVVMLAALAAFEKTPNAANLGWTILLTPDEETGSVVSRATIEAAAPDHVLGLVFEPARESGAMVRSRAATGAFTFTIHGRAAHAGRDPDAGRNAIVTLVELCFALENLPLTISDLLVNVAHIQGGGPVNIVPDLASVTIGARASTPEAANEFEEAIARLVKALNVREGYRTVLTGQFNRAPLQSTPTTERHFADLQTCGRDLNLPPFDWAAVAGGSDANLLHAAGLPCLDGLGPIGGGLHSADEYIELPSLVQRAQLAALFLHRFASACPA